MYIERTLSGYLVQASKQFPVVLVAGPRQVGKTTLLQHLAKESRGYVTLDDPTLAQLARDEPALFLQRFEPPVLIDEIQYAPQLLPYIKMRVDRDRRAGMYWLTGSQQFQLMKGISESLAGRVAIVNLLGLSLKELQGKAVAAEPFLPMEENLHKRLNISSPLSLPDVYRIIWRGSYPAMWILAPGDGWGDMENGDGEGGGNGDGRKALKSNGVDRDLFYSSYVQTYLQRDVRDLAQVGDVGTFLKFLRAAAARTGQLLNMSDMGRDAGVSATTAKNWLSILQGYGVVCVSHRMV
jgi:predicted AAA+ superfamily ATPase